MDESSETKEVNILIKERNLLLDELKTNLYKAWEQIKKTIDRHCREVIFNVGDQVFLKLQPYRFISLAVCPNEKLSS